MASRLPRAYHTTKGIRTQKINLINPQQTAKMSLKIEDYNIPPPSSQSHFSKFQDFVPDDDASFENEFARLASSQSWVPGSQQFTKERTIAMREELKFHFFSQSPLEEEIDEIQDQDQDQDTKMPKKELTPEEIDLQGYQMLCQEVRITPSDSILECKRMLKKTLVNIIDLINTRRTKAEVKVWDDFEAFRRYTLDDEHRIDPNEAKEDGGYLASLLQRLRRPKGRRGRYRQSNGTSRVVSGRVSKRIR